MIKRTKNCFYLGIKGLFYMRISRNPFRDFYFDNWIKADNVIYLGLYFIEIKLKLK